MWENLDMNKFAFSKIAPFNLQLIAFIHVNNSRKKYFISVQEKKLYGSVHFRNHIFSSSLMSPRKEIISSNPKENIYG